MDYELLDLIYGYRWAEKGWQLAGKSPQDWVFIGKFGWQDRKGQWLIQG
jgi:hypothetical protein